MGLREHARDGGAGVDVVTLAKIFWRASAFFYVIFASYASANTDGECYGACEM